MLGLEQADGFNAQTQKFWDERKPRRRPNGVFKVFKKTLVFHYDTLPVI